MSALTKTRLLRVALEGLEAKSQASEIEPADVTPLINVACEIEREPSQVEAFAQRLALLEASALRQRVGGALFTEISDLRTEVLSTLARQRNHEAKAIVLTPAQHAVVSSIASRISGRAKR